MLTTSPSYNKNSYGPVNSTSWLLWNRQLGVITNPLGGALTSYIGNTAQLLFYVVANNGSPGSTQPPEGAPALGVGVYQIAPNEQVYGTGFSWQYDVYVASLSGTQQILMEDLTGCVPENITWSGGIPLTPNGATNPQYVAAPEPQLDAAPGNKVSNVSSENSVQLLRYVVRNFLQELIYLHLFQQDTAPTTNEVPYLSIPIGIGVPTSPTKEESGPGFDALAGIPFADGLAWGLSSTADLYTPLAAVGPFVEIYFR